jgi:O-antigen/teichoic acid export membrane protein
MEKPRIKAAATIHVAVAQLVLQLSSLARYAIVARLISPEEFGISALIGGAAQLVELLSSAGSDTILVQAPDGNDVRLQNAIHMLRVMRGAVNAGILFVFAGPIAQLFSLEQYATELRLLALFPLIRGLYHTDCNRLQRHRKFSAWIAAEVIPNVLTSLLVVCLAIIWPDHRSMLAGVLFQALAGVIISHMVSERSYSWSYDKTAFKRFAEYGWPLVANSLLIFAITQGDRFLIGSAKTIFGNNALTLESLGVYSATVTLTMAPSVALGNVILSVGLPYLAAVQDVAREYSARFQRCLQWTILATMCYLMFFSYLGPTIITWISGVQYRPSRLLVTALAGLWGLRMVRTVFTVGALGLGDTKNGLYSNSGRLMSFLLAYGAIAKNGTTDNLAVIGCAGEAIAILLSGYLLRMRSAFCIAEGRHVLMMTTPIMLCTLLVGVADTGFWSAAIAVIVMSIGVMKALPIVKRDIREAIR